MRRKVWQCWLYEIKTTSSMLMITRQSNQVNSSNFYTNWNMTRTLIQQWWLWQSLALWHSLCHIGAAIKHPVPDRVKPSCNFWHPDTLTLSPECRCPDAKNYKWRLNPVWHRMLYSCTHMATVGVKGLQMEDKEQCNLVMKSTSKTCQQCQSSVNIGSILNSVSQHFSVLKQLKIRALNQAGLYLVFQSVVLKCSPLLLLLPVGALGWQTTGSNTK